MIMRMRMMRIRTRARIIIIVIPVMFIKVMRKINRWRIKTIFTNDTLSCNLSRSRSDTVTEIYSIVSQ